MIKSTAPIPDANKNKEIAKSHRTNNWKKIGLEFLSIFIAVISALH